MSSRALCRASRALTLAAIVQLSCAPRAPGHGATPSPNSSIENEQASLASDPERADAVTKIGAKLTQERVRVLETKLARDPSDLETRLLLIGYYGQGGGEGGPSGEPYDTLVIGVFERYPRSVLAGSWSLGDPSFERGAAVWRSLVAAHPRDAAILGNAGSYFVLNIIEPENRRLEGVRLLESAARIDPTEPRWPYWLGFVDSLLAGDAASSPPASRATAVRGLERTERAIHLVGASRLAWFEPRRLEVVERLAELAWLAGSRTKTREYANRTLQVARTWRTEWQRADAINTAESLLGYLELAEGRIEEAEQHLLASARVPGSPVLGSYGPDLGLAAELLARGRAESVLSYLELCKGFWQPGPGVLDEFERTIRTGRTPDFSGHIHVALRNALSSPE